ncbi:MULTISPECIES: TraR/DksA family transcriptional regulator [Streptomyces]|uniref:TraR/DksA family transcriptional regulator n=1 Tax=Streptomyces TaxID=1883 RepID=UPI000BD201C3|nr:MULTISPECIES: TraR/DksA C4-type zinc finger protein [Streptomyces]MDX2556174.1 TraR/DksA C4-type zinc finger protein [Streptomyces stelliscabiei]MDX2616762.1 TraR/DksA C4-type zinc finger protein [Streptomyces stelliscabiei]MDX2640025.1 TraR/DksA C4-type zinc finger protein [Streptomyces stelliscabiei]MDX2665253.1 TraR/DksA C4-type zinc finger protein [Streptomyces stelliscabiei]MDX2716859.1 TraR/DksA C4-type zinc finger protein [Streptomyces stelliscabiei]
MGDASRHDPGSPAFPAARARLVAARAETLARAAALSRDFDGIVAANALIAVDDEHDPEGGTTAFERAHVAALIAQAREHLEELDRALERLDRGHYGRCEGCGMTITPERLEIRPAATMCVRCAGSDTRPPPRTGRTLRRPPHNT